MKKEETKEIKKDTKICKACRSEIDKKATVCPNCRKKQGSPLLLIIGIVIIIIGIVALASGGSSSGENKEEKFSHTVEKSYQDKSGFGYYIEGIVTNKKDKDYSYVQIEFVCYDKDGNNLGTALANTNNLLGNETWKYKAMGMFTNQKVGHCDFKEITGW